MVKCPICDKEYKKLTLAHVSTKLHKSNLAKKNIKPEDDPTLELIKQKIPTRAQASKDSVASGKIKKEVIKQQKTKVEPEHVPEKEDKKKIEDETLGKVGKKEEDKQAPKIKTDKTPEVMKKQEPVAIMKSKGSPGKKEEMKALPRIPRTGKEPEKPPKEKEEPEKPPKEKEEPDTTRKKKKKISGIFSRKKNARSKVVIDTVKHGVMFYIKELEKWHSIKYLLKAIGTIAIAVIISFVLGQISYKALDTNASNSGHLYSIIFSSIGFFFFAKQLRKRESVNYVRTFLMLYFLIYFIVVMIIVLFLKFNQTYFYSTTGNALILFSVFTLLIFLLSPDILGLAGGFKVLFRNGKHIRVLLVYMAISLLQIAGFALLNYAINLEAVSSASSSSGYAFNVDEDFSLLDFFYLSTITFTTIGYGDLHPISNAAKFSGIIQAFLSHIISLLFLAILLLYLSSSIDINENDEEPEENKTSK
ncbi:MAG: ion channel [Promethearchaeota archaeon]